MKNNLENSQRDKANLDEKLHKIETELRNEKASWENKASDLESDLLVCFSFCCTHIEMHSE